jgi:6-phosphogluconolactonase
MRTAVLVCDDADVIAARALDLLVTQLGWAIGVRGEAHLALTGGSSAAALFAALRSTDRARRVTWPSVHVWLGDERFVPTDAEDSNWGLARREWLARPGAPPIAASRQHPVPVDEALAGGHDPAWAAARYEVELGRVLPHRRGLPAFDVVLLGVGTDGHILSAFPAGDPISAMAGSVMAVDAPTHIGPHLPRVTLVPRLLAAAGLIIVMVPGTGKRDTIRYCFGPVYAPSRWPAQLAIRPNAVWLLDRACAGGWLVDLPAAGSSAGRRPGRGAPSSPMSSAR